MFAKKKWYYMSEFINHHTDDEESGNMAKEKAPQAADQALAEVQPRTLPAVSKLTPATVIGVSTQLQLAQELLPEEFRGVELEVIETGFSPTVKWMEQGNYIAGRYVGKEEGIGPNKSRLYSFTTKGEKRFGVWGTTVLDRAFNEGMEKMELQPDGVTELPMIRPGRMLMITYMGSVETDKEPCKLFHIAIAKTKTAKVD